MAKATALVEVFLVPHSAPLRAQVHASLALPQWTIGAPDDAEGTQATAVFQEIIADIAPLPHALSFAHIIPPTTPQRAGRAFRRSSTSFLMAFLPF